MRCNGASLEANRILKVLMRNHGRKTEDGVGAWWPPSEGRRGWRQLDRAQAYLGDTPWLSSPLTSSVVPELPPISLAPTVHMTPQQVASMVPHRDVLSHSKKKGGRHKGKFWKKKVPPDIQCEQVPAWMGRTGGHESHYDESISDTRSLRPRKTNSTGKGSNTISSH